MATGETEVDGPTTVPSYCYYSPIPNLETFLMDKLSQVPSLRGETKQIEDLIIDFLHFSEYNDDANILDKLEHVRRQFAVNHELFETEEARNKFKEEKERQTLTQIKHGAQLSLWSYDKKTQTRAFSLE